MRNTLLTDIARFLSTEEEADELVTMTGRMTVIPEGPYRALQVLIDNPQQTPREAKILTCYALTV